MARARARAAVADVTLLLVDLEAALQDASALEAVEALFDSRAILLLNTADRCDAAAVRRPCESLQDRNPVVISAKTGEGLDLSLRSEEHTSELQALMPSSYSVFILKTKIQMPILT